MSTLDLVVPAVVVGGCLLIVVAVLWFGRERKPRWSIEAPVDDGEPAVSVDPEALAGWHRDHGAAVTAWITAHEAALRRLGDAELSVDLTDPSLFEGVERATAPYRDALGEHPSAVMRAELSAMQVAADATLHAVKRADYTTAERQHLTYLGYRDEWVGRLRQFSLDDPALAELRRSLSDDAAVAAMPSPLADHSDDSHDPDDPDSPDDPDVGDLRLSS